MIEEHPERLVTTCWCGVTGPVDELFDDDAVETDCGGTGTVHCYCGGDLCVCHNHGECECFGCESCDEADPDFDELD